MTDPLHAGDCACGRPIIRRTLAGVAPKRCDECRLNLDGKSPNRIAGPPTQMRQWIRDTRTQLETAGAGSPHDLMRECAAVAMADTIGVPDDMADSILCAIERLVHDGESGLSIRRRLNSPLFGVKSAAEAAARRGLEEAIMGFDGRDDA